MGNALSEHAWDALREAMHSRQMTLDAAHPPARAAEAPRPASAAPSSPADAAFEEGSSSLLSQSAYDRFPSSFTGPVTSEGSSRRLAPLVPLEAVEPLEAHFYLGAHPDGSFVGPGGITPISSPRPSAEPSPTEAGRRLRLSAERGGVPRHWAWSPSNSTDALPGASQDESTNAGSPREQKGILRHWLNMVGESNSSPD